jgi:hypothetical protein
VGREEAERKITDFVREQFAREMDRMCMGAITGSTATVAQEETTLNVAEMLRSCEQILRNSRREQITFVVDAGHDGPILKHNTPCDGERVEMSWRQAQELHQHWPLKLWKVNSPEQAEFVPVSGIFPEFVPRVLPMPPFEMPQEDQPSTQPESN